MVTGGGGGGCVTGGGGGGGCVVFAEPATAVFPTDEVTVVGTTVAIGWVPVWPWVTGRLPEIVCGTPLLTTAASVGMPLAPPVPPVRPSSCPMSWANFPAGTAAG